MSRILSVSGRGVPLRGNDIDTDRIIPARFLRCVTFDGLGEHAFADDRKQLTAAGKTHTFDDARFVGGEVLVVGGNFGCGSSREHAPQALQKWGIKAVVGVSFSEIFFGNTVAMGMPCVRLPQADIEAVQAAIEADPRIQVTVDIEHLEVRWNGGKKAGATMPEGARKQFLTGQWDATGELIEGIGQVRITSAKLPYVAGFAG
ncbi:MAG: 3-isopropylmalate dehydratase small subunit [Planctomycetes bacterium]|nr:3-isopropylmalate dehydratase small subunit [Planctomycetota bacterium]